MADLDETGVYDLTCPSNHRTAFCLQNFKFELLFDLGLQAIDDGYYREAVSSFASALERFHEFYVEAALLGAGTNRDVYDVVWKAVRNQSERQLGAFLFLYAREERSAPPILSSSDTEFRNGVVHKGKFPQREETIAFGRKVQDIIRPTLRRLRERLGDGLQEMRMRLLAELRRKVEPGVTVVNLYQITFISASDELNAQFDIQERVDALKLLRDGTA